MDRDQRKLDPSHDEMTFTMVTPAERDSWMRTFPHPMPATHVHRITWGTNERGQAVLTVRPEPRAGFVPEVSPAPAAVPAVAGAVVAPTVDAAQPALTPVAPAGDDVLARIEGLSEPDLLVAAAENEVPLKGDESRAQIVALILDKLTAPAAK
jgi:hypothetical protein